MELFCHTGAVSGQLVCTHGEEHDGKPCLRAAARDVCHGEVREGDGHGPVGREQAPAARLQPQGMPGASVR